jgi:hypothetical protein
MEAMGSNLGRDIGNIIHGFLVPPDTEIVALVSHFSWKNKGPMIRRGLNSTPHLHLFTMTLAV